MRLLIQLLLLSTIQLLLRGIGWFVRILLPIFALVLRILWILVGMSFTAMAIGPSKYIETIGYEWSNTLIDRGGNPQNRSQIHSLCRFLVIAVLVLGWFFSMIFTLWLLRVVFGFFT